MAALDERVILFAQSYGSETASTLTAYAALYRVEALIEDARVLKATLGHAPHSAPWYGHEILSYYSVGFATCLEWHARARTFNLFSFMPECVKTDDFKINVSSKFLTQMMKDKVTIPGVLAGSISIGSADEYLKRFTRIFEALAF